MTYIRLNSNKFERLLDDLGWSYQEVSRQTEKFGKKLSVSAISGAAKGNSIYRKTAKLIADALGVTVSEIKEDRRMVPEFREEGEIQKEDRANPGKGGKTKKNRGDIE